MVPGEFEPLGYQEKPHRITVPPGTDVEIRVPEYFDTSIEREPLRSELSPMKDVRISSVIETDVESTHARVVTQRIQFSTSGERLSLVFERHFQPPDAGGRMVRSILYLDYGTGDEEGDGEA